MYVDHSEDGRHYAVSDPVWADKPVRMINGFQFAYFINSLVNGGVVGQEKSQQKSPLGFDVEVTDRYYQFSDQIDTGSYDLSDSSDDDNIEHTSNVTGGTTYAPFGSIFGSAMTVSLGGDATTSTGDYTTVSSSQSSSTASSRNP